VLLQHPQSSKIPCVLNNVTNGETEEIVCDIVAPRRFCNINHMRFDESYTASPLFSCVSFGNLHFFLTVLKSKRGNFGNIYKFVHYIGSTNIKNRIRLNTGKSYAMN
jgi:hypothetical protein